MAGIVILQLINQPHLTAGFGESSQPFLLAQNSVYLLLRSVIDSPRWGDDWYNPSVLLLAAFPILPHGFGNREYMKGEAYEKNYYYHVGHS